MMVEKEFENFGQSDKNSWIFFNEIEKRRNLGNKFFGEDNFKED